MNKPGHLRDVLKSFPKLAGKKTIHIVSCTNKTKKTGDMNLKHIENGDTGSWKVAVKREIPIKKGDVIVVVMSALGGGYPKDIYCGTIRGDVRGVTGEPVVFPVVYFNRKNRVAQVEKSTGITKFLGTNTPQGNTVRSLQLKKTRPLLKKIIEPPHGLVEKSIFSKEDLEVLRSIELQRDLADTQRTAQIQARIGQGKFRTDVLKKWQCRCAVTGLSEKGLLVASHVVPWIDCKNGDDRVNPLNALLLTPNIDRLFDRKALHLISFNEVGDMLYRSDITEVHKNVIRQIVPRYLKSTWKERGFNQVELNELGKFLKEHQKGFSWNPKRDLDHTYLQSARTE